MKKEDSETRRQECQRNSARQEVADKRISERIDDLWKRELARLQTVKDRIRLPPLSQTRALTQEAISEKKTAVAAFFKYHEGQNPSEEHFLKFLTVVRNPTKWTYAEEMIYESAEYVRLLSTWLRDPETQPLSDTTLYQQLKPVELVHVASKVVPVEDYVPVFQGYMDKAPALVVENKTVEKGWVNSRMVIELAEGPHTDVVRKTYVGEDLEKITQLRSRALSHLQQSVNHGLSYLGNPFQVRPRMDISSHLPILFGKDRMEVSTSVSRPATRKKEEWFVTEVHHPIPAAIMKGEHRDLKPVLVQDFPLLGDLREVTSEVSEKYQITLNARYFYCMGNLLACFLGLPAVSRIIDYDKALVLAYETYLTDTLVYTRTKVLGVPYQVYVYEKGTDMRYRQILVEHLQMRDVFWFFDVEGKSSRGAYGLARLQWSPGSATAYLLYEEGGKIPKGVPLYCKGATRERAWLTEHSYDNPVFDLDAVIPWVVEPVHSPFGGVLQMALQVYLLKEGCSGSLVDLAPWTSCFQMSKEGQMKGVLLFLNVTDQIVVEICHKSSSASVFEHFDKDSPPLVSRPSHTFVSVPDC